MGQQQLLLIALGAIVVGIAIVIAIQLYRTHAIEHKRDLLANESVVIASNALSYYKKPMAYGGGANSFNGWEIPPSLLNTENGTYIADVQPDQVVIVATGTETITGNDDYIQVQTTVANDSISTVIVR